MAKVKFDDVVKRININVDRFNTSRLYYVGGEHIESCEFMVHEKGLIKGSTIGYKFHYGFDPGHILFMSRNPHLRKASMVDFAGVCSDSTYVVETRNEDVLLQKYLLLEMQSDRFWNWMEEHKTGGVNYLINYCTLKEYEFELPAIETQKVLVTKAWAAYNLIESYRTLITSIDGLFTGQFIKRVGYFDSNIHNYEVKTVRDVISETYVGEWGGDDETGNGTRVIRTTNFTNLGVLDLEDVVTRDIPKQKVIAKRLQPCDIIIEKSGGTEEMPVGRVVLFNESEDYLFNNFTQVLRPSDEFNKIFVFVSLYQFYHRHKEIMYKLYTQTTGIQNLRFEKFLDNKIVIPSRDIQDEIAKLYMECEDNKLKASHSISIAENIIKSLINS